MWSVHHHVIGTFRPLNSVLCVSISPAFCVLILSAVWWNLLALIVQQLYLLAFVVKVCWLFSCLVLLTYCCPQQFWCSVSVVVFIFTTKFKLEFAWVSCGKVLNLRGCKNEAGTCKFENLTAWLKIWKKTCSSHMHVLKGGKEIFKSI